MTHYLDQRIDPDSADFIATFDEAPLWSARFGALLVDHAPLVPGGVIVDVACGTGFPLFELAGMHGPAARLLGVDLWPAALRQAARKRRAYAMPWALPLQADAARLPLANNSVDLITSNVGLNNFENAAAALAECARVLKPGGHIALTTNTQGHMAEFYAVFREVLAELGRADALPRLARNEGHRATREGLAAQLEAAGFTVSRTAADRYTLRCASGRAFFHHRLIVEGFLDAWRAVVTPADERAVFAALEARLDALAAQQGELRLTIPMVYMEGRKG